MPNLTDSLPASAYHAVRYSDWQVGALAYLPCQRPTYCQSTTLPEAERRSAISRSTVEAAPHYLIVDTFGDGAAAYYPAASAPAAYGPFGAMVLEAARRLRRWRYYSDSDAPAAAPNLPLDGCHCRTCLLRE